MTLELPLRCTCGKLRGRAEGMSPRLCNRLVCYCDDCQTFARALDREDVLDPYGGIDVLYMPPARMHLESRDELCCLRLSPKGLYRFYAGCCRTPVANVFSGNVPFVSLFDCFTAHGDRSRDELFGPPIGRIHGRYGKGGLPPGAHPKASIGTIARTSVNLLKWWLGGLGQPSPFFERGAKEPRVVPRVLDKSERDAARPPSA